MWQSELFNSLVKKNNLIYTLDNYFSIIRLISTLICLYAANMFKMFQQSRILEGDFDEKERIQKSKIKKFFNFWSDFYLEFLEFLKFFRLFIFNIFRVKFLFQIFWKLVLCTLGIEHTIENDWMKDWAKLLIWLSFLCPL